MIRETAYETLNRIAQIEDTEERKRELRRIAIQNNIIAIIVQRTYHPDYNFDLPKGVPDGARKSNHTEPGPFYTSIRRWDKFRPANEVPINASMCPETRVNQFIQLYESVSYNDADLLVGVKDKKLPWPTLSGEFVVDALPELFPCSFRVEDAPSTPTESGERANATAEEARSIIAEQSANMAGSRKDLCKKIMQDNPGLSRKDYIELFEKVGISKITGSQYYQALKDKV